MTGRATPNRGCEKCGSDDIHTAWHRSNYDCIYHQRITRITPEPEGEHLHRSCRGCGFHWYDPVLKAAAT